MNRKHLFGLLALLLALPPLAIQAQRLTGYEYWFDGQVGSRVSKSLSGYEADIETSIATQHLSGGLHTLHLRFKQSGGEYEYSPVTSQIFFKHNAEEGGKIEYWFDDDISNSATVSLPSTAIDDTVNVALTMANAIKFPLGFHQLNIRVSTEGKSLSNIYTTHVLKVPSGEIDAIEYWVDGDYSTRKTVEGHVASTDDKAYIFTNPFDLSGVPSGPHRIYYRPASKNGNACGAVSMATVIVGGGTPSKIEYWFDDDVAHSATMALPATALSDTVVVALAMNNSEKFPLGMHQLSMRMVTDSREQSPIYAARVLKKASGKIDVLEYWVDNDLAHSHTITGEAATGDENTYDFNNSFDLSNVSEGFHRIYYRAASANGKASSAVSMTPVMVKSRYNVEDKDNLTVTEHAYWIDNNESTIVSVARPENEIEQPYKIDIRNLSDGQHTLHLQYANSLGIWSSPADYTFTKAKMPAPKITATASVKDGVVTLKFNTVPYGLVYTVVRKYPSGKLRKVEDIKDAEYPADIKSIDAPGIGTYTYYIDAKYLDANGEKQKLLSEEMSVTVDKAASTVKRGSIHGVIELEGVRSYVESNRYKIYINEKDAKDTEYSLKKEGGAFLIEGVPHGTEMTIGIKIDGYPFNNYAFKNITLLVSENTSDRVFHFNGTKDGVDDLQPDNTAYDLSLTDRIHLSRIGWQISVHNRSKNKPWSGNIIVKQILKKQKDFYDKARDEGVPLWYYYLHGNAGLDDGPVYKTVADETVKLAGGEYRDLTLKIIDMPEGNEKEDYYVCVFSKEEGSNELKELYDCGDKSFRNPQTLSFNPFEYPPMQEIDSYIDEYKEVLNYLKMMSNWGDPFAFEIKSIKNFDEFVNNLGNGSIDYYAIGNDVIANTSHAAGFFLSYFLNEVNSAVTVAAKSVKKSQSIKVADGIEEVYKHLSGFYNSNQVDDHLKFFETSKQVLKVCESLGKYLETTYPALSIYKNYFEVGASMANAIEKIENSKNAPFIFNKLVNGKAIYKIKVRRYSEDKNKVEYFSGSDFYQKENANDHHWGQIKDIKIELIMPPSTDPARSKSLKVVVNKDENGDSFAGITIKNVEFNNYQTELPTTYEAWMTITWNNNRVTNIPLLDNRFVKLENIESVNEDDPITMTVEFQSDSYHKENLANRITIIKQR